MKISFEMTLHLLLEIFFEPTHLFLVPEVKVKLEEKKHAVGKVTDFGHPVITESFRHIGAARDFFRMDIMTTSRP